MDGARPPGGYHRFDVDGLSLAQPNPHVPSSQTRPVSGGRTPLIRDAERSVFDTARRRETVIPPARSPRVPRPRRSARPGAPRRGSRTALRPRRAAPREIGAGDRGPRGPRRARSGSPACPLARGTGPASIGVIARFGCGAADSFQRSIAPSRLTVPNCCLICALAIARPAIMRVVLSAR